MTGLVASGLSQKPGASICLVRSASSFSLAGRSKMPPEPCQFLTGGFDQGLEIFVHGVVVPIRGGGKKVVLLFLFRGFLLGCFSWLGLGLGLCFYFCFRFRLYFCFRFGFRFRFDLCFRFGFRFYL